ncbi:MAG: hypothetical protein JNL94_13160 [Planctomycetes bacterium]|nr:hypothetical protein [Planctomycetota bacterium]
MKLHAALLAGSLVWSAAPAGAQSPQPFTFRPASRYLSEVPTPAALLGYELGARFTPHEALLRAVDAIDAASDRVEVRRYGTTGAGRPLVLATVSSPANLARLSDVRDGMRRLADPRARKSPAERDALLASLPVVVWLSFNVHGNEPSPSESALATLWHYAAAADDATTALLDRTVIVLDPCLNPDGRERYVRWLQSVMGPVPNPDPHAEEHSEPWPGGRFNHNLFDLNRDWAFLTQPETQARVRAYRELLPQVHVDFHEMYPDSSYFFFPAAAPINSNLPRHIARWGSVFGTSNAAAFDRHAWPYYTGEDFDLFYPGYGDAWPSFNGAIGMTYEQAGHSPAGVVIRREDGELLTLHDRTAHHFTAALATVATAAEHRDELLADFARFFEDAIWEGENGPERAFVLVPGRDRDRCDELVDLLIRQGIEVHQATAPFEAKRAHAYAPDVVDDRRFPAGAFVVSLAQPMKHLARTLLEPRSPVREPFFYDVSAWSLPLLFDVEAYWTEQPVTAELIPAADRAPRSGGVDGGVASVAYLVHWDSFRSPRVLDRLLRGGVRVSTATRAFTMRGEDFAPGTLLVPVAGNAQDVHTRVVACAEELGVRMVAVSSSLTEKGPDLGAESFRPVAVPSIGVVTGSGTSPSSVGPIRFLFESKLGVRCSMLPLDDLAGIDLTDYSVLVVPDGFDYGRKLADGGFDALRQYVERGGSIVGIANGAFALTKERGGFVDVRTRDDEQAPPAEAKDREWLPSKAVAERMRQQQVPGTLFSVRLDPDHPLAFGDDDASLAVLMEGATAFTLKGQGSRLGVFGPDSLLSGFASSENVAKLNGKAYLADVRIGRGHVILFANDPNFRGFARGQTGLFLNAVYRFGAVRE